MALAFGLDTFGDVTLDDDDTPLTHPEVVRNVVAEGILADQVGVDVFGVGEHHRADFAISAPEIALTAIASQTERILLGTAVTVLSSDDPVRVYERFATLDAISGGRAEVTLGRGSFIESFPLFGFDLTDYERLFTEKLELWAALQGEEPVTWQGSVRGPLADASVFPRTARGHIPTWVGVGGSPESVIRTAQYGFGLMLAVIGGAPARFAPFADLFRRALSQYGHEPQPIGVHSPGFIAPTDAEARDLLYPYFKSSRDRIGKERGWGPVTREQFEADVDGGALFVGSPETVAQKIADTVTTLGLDRFDLKYSNGPMAHRLLRQSIELYGTEVIPRVRAILAEQGATDD